MLDTFHGPLPVSTCFRIYQPVCVRLSQALGEFALKHSRETSVLAKDLMFPQWTGSHANLRLVAWQLFTLPSNVQLKRHLKRLQKNLFAAEKQVKGRVEALSINIEPSKATDGQHCLKSPSKLHLARNCDGN